MNYEVMREAQQRAMEAARAVPGVRWTILLPLARMTYWTDADGTEHVQTPSDYPPGFKPWTKEAKRRKRAPREVA